MRLHRLSATAFGPFKATAEVDFDSLGEAGLFLLSGATGAGKSSILDAVCFALYGDVPGDRSTAKRLRCDHAEPDARPVVELEVTLSGRRFLLERSPAWDRPKRRGTGMTTEQARVVVQEWMDGEWTTRSTRLDEAGHLMTSLVGMNLAQFCQVALLPQGRFQAFLRARSEERHALLQQVFRTGRFDQVERWLQDHRTAARRQSEATRQEASDLVSRLCEVVDDSPPEDWEEQPDHLHTWLAASNASLSRALAAHDQALARARTRLTTARETLAEATAFELARTAHTAALERLAALQERAAVVDAERLRLAQARRAAPVKVLDTVAAEALVAVRAAEQAATWATERLAALLDTDSTALDSEAAESARRQALLSQQVVAGVRPLQQERDTILDQHSRLAGQRLQVLADAERERNRAQVAVDRLGDELSSATARVQALTGELVAAKELWLEVREARLSGIAAEIAGRLVVGGCCPVCGSHEHPSPAATAPDAPDAAAERSARRAVDDLEVTCLAAQESATRIQVALGAAREALQRDPRAGELADVEARMESAEQRLADVDTRLEQALEGQPPLDVDSLRRHWEDVESAAQAALRCRDVVAAATEAHARSRTESERSATSVGFRDASAALAVVLDHAAQERLEVGIRRHDDAIAKAQESLAAAPAPAMPVTGPPDVAGLTREVDDADAAVASLAQRHHAVEKRAVRLATLATSLREVLGRWAPQQQALAVAAAMSSFVAGKSADNRLQMRLSAYVLASRLSQVVAAANVRLSTMSDHRYTLEHTGQRGAGETRGGLSLLVRDDWSGESRDPATLSGGETFVVSLALALGLADVITQEVGGAQVDTLFVDEGFGSLDADTLEDVMSTLDSLRDGGRCVGVVSHVPEMQTRIPAQLRVHKSREGSHVTQHLG